ncbi:16S rRNA (cytosine(967)-C(5))-methyltransferase, partial [bacterium]|nr:16S rRNA (cytosine(967)-C(5))-methyltransferase [bacterium]
RWRFRPAGQRKLVLRQARILAGALSAVREGGRLVYTVCSIEREEGAELLASALAGSSSSIETELSRLPSPDGGDGGYAALVR